MVFLVDEEQLRLPTHSTSRKDSCLPGRAVRSRFECCGRSPQPGEVSRLLALAEETLGVKRMRWF